MPDLHARHRGYRHLVAWCQYMRSFEYYTLNQIDKAVADHAPMDAIYERTNPDGTRTWCRASEIVSPDTRATIEALVALIREKEQP